MKSISHHTTKEVFDSNYSGHNALKEAFKSSLLHSTSWCLFSVATAAAQINGSCGYLTSVRNQSVIQLQHPLKSSSFVLRENFTTKLRNKKDSDWASYLLFGLEYWTCLDMKMSAHKYKSSATISICHPSPGKKHEHNENAYRRGACGAVTAGVCAGMIRRPNDATLYRSWWYAFRCGCGMANTKAGFLFLEWHKSCGQWCICHRTAPSTDATRLQGIFICRKRVVAVKMKLELLQSNILLALLQARKIVCLSTMASPPEKTLGLMHAYWYDLSVSFRTAVFHGGWNCVVTSSYLEEPSLLYFRIPNGHTHRSLKRIESSLLI